MVYVFTIPMGVVVVKAEDIYAAMRNIITNWDPHAFEEEFSVRVAEGASGFEQLDP